MVRTTEIERPPYAIICEEKRWFHDLINICPGKNKKPETTRITGPPSPPLFSLQKQPLKIVLKSSCSKISQNSVENTRGGFVLVPECRACYPQKAIFLIAVPKSNYRMCSLKKLVSKIS